jgi:hypothetical protein
MSGPVLEPPFGPQNLAAYKLAQDRRHFPYGTDAVSRMPAAKREELIAQLGLSSGAALELVFDLMEQRHYAEVRAKIMEIGRYAGLDLSDIGYLEILLGAPNVQIVRDPNDGSLALGIDPGVWHRTALSYVLASMGRQVGDFSWYLALEYLAWQYFELGQDNGGAEIIEHAVAVLAKSDPGVQSMAADVLGTAISMMLAHEVGHLALGHRKAAGDESVRLDSGSAQRIEATIYRDHSKEMTADVWAANALLAMAGNDFKQRTLAVTVPALMFWLRAVPALITHRPTEVGREQAKHHPADAKRAASLELLAATHIGTDVAPSNAMATLLDLTKWVRQGVRRWETDRAGQTREFNAWCARLADGG